MAVLTAQAMARPAPSPAASLPRRTVELSEIVAEPFQDRVTVDGVLEPLRHGSLGFRVGGRIQELRIEEGRTAAAGEVLARLDDRELRAALQAAEAEADRARAALDRLSRGLRSEDLRSLEHALAAAEAELEAARLDHQRMASLAGRSAATTASLDSARTREDAAKARRAAAAAGLEKGRNGARDEDRREAEAVLALARARADSARLDLEAATLVAPFPGTVARKPLAPGTVVGPGTPVVDLVDLSTLEARIGIPEAFGPAFGEGALVEVSVLGTRFEGTVVAVAPTLDPHTRTYFARVSVAAPAGALRAGRAVEVTGTMPARPVLAIPARALVATPRGGLALFVASEEPTPGASVTGGAGGSPTVPGLAVHRHEVDGVWLSDGRLAVTRGLAGGSRVVVSGAAWLLDGDRVVASRPVEARRS